MSNGLYVEGLDRLVRQAELVAHLESMLFSRLLRWLPVNLLAVCHRSALLLSSRRSWAIFIRPNDPRERRIPRYLVRRAYHLVAERRERGRRQRERQAQCLSVSGLHSPGLHGIGLHGLGNLGWPTGLGGVTRGHGLNAHVASLPIEKQREFQFRHMFMGSSISRPSSRACSRMEPD